MQKWEMCYCYGAINEQGDIDCDSLYQQIGLLGYGGASYMVDFKNRPEEMEAMNETQFVISKLYQLGQEGWELVQIVGRTMWFKRPIP